MRRSERDGGLCLGLWSGLGGVHTSGREAACGMTRPLSWDGVGSICYGWMDITMRPLDNGVKTILPSVSLE